MNKNFNQLCDENVKVYAELTNFFYENILKDTDNMQDFINKINKHFNFNLTLDDLREELRSSNRFIIINNDGLKLDISIYNINVEVSIWNKFYDKNNTSYNRINVFERKDYEFLNLYKSFKDFIDKPLFKEFKNYFDYNQEKVDHFLDVLKRGNIKSWEYKSYSRCELDGLSVEHYLHETEKIIFDNINIIHYTKRFLIDREVEVEKLLVIVNDIKIFETLDIVGELSIKILEFIGQVKKQKR